MTFHEAFAFVFEGFKPKNRHQLSLLFNYTTMDHQGLGYLEKEVMQRFYTRLFIPVLTIGDELIENSTFERREFLNFHYSKHNRRQLEFLSLLKFAMDSYYIDDNEKEGTINVEGAIITQSDIGSAKKDVLEFIEEEISILKKNNVTDLRDDNPDLAYAGQVQLAMYYYYRQVAGSIPWFEDQEGGLEAQAKFVHDTYKVSAQNFKNRYTEVRNAKTGKEFRIRKSQSDNRKSVIDLLKSDQKARECARIENDEANLLND